MRNESCKRQCKPANFARFFASNMLSNALKLLAIPAGFEPATIGLEGRKPSPEICGFETFRTVNRTRQQTWEFVPSVNGEPAIHAARP